MKLARAVLGRLDAWAALLLGVLLTLGVVILLATPGPWQDVITPSDTPVEPRARGPSDVAVFARAGPEGACTAVLWLHVDHVRPALTVVVLAPDTQGFVPGAGLTPLRRVVDDVGPASAAAALGRTLGVRMDAWVALDRPAVRLAVGPMLPPGDGRVALVRFARAKATWEGAPSAEGWVRQYEALLRGLPRIPLQDLSVVTFSNYVLGFGHVRSNLDLRASTALATAFAGLRPTQIEVRAAAVVVQTCRRGRAWRVDASQVETLRRWLAFDLAPPGGSPSIRVEPRPARVLVVLPGRYRHADDYVRVARRRLRRSAGAPIAVRVLRVSRWPELARRTTSAIDEWRPLAVLVGPPMTEGSPPADASMAAALREVGTVLRGAGQAAVLSSGLPATGETGVTNREPGGGDPVAAALAATALPLSPLERTAALMPTADRSGAAARLRVAARANVDTLVRACWPGTLAPRLASTRVGFSFAGRRRTLVAVVDGPTTAAARSTSRLSVWGYRVRPPIAGRRRALRPAIVVAYRKGHRRAAYAVAGDFGLRAGAVVADGSAPAAVAVRLRP